MWISMLGGIHWKGGVFGSTHILADLGESALDTKSNDIKD